MFTSKAALILLALIDIFGIVPTSLFSITHRARNVTIFRVYMLTKTYVCLYIQSLQDLGTVYSKMGDLDKAVSVYNDAINRQNRIRTPSQKIQVSPA